MSSTIQDDWHYYRARMSELAEQQKLPWHGLTSHVQTFRELTVRVIERDTAIDSPRPQDYVTSVLVTFAFRATIGSLHLAISGFPELATELNRKVWEIGLRLLQLHANPVEIAYGYLLHSVSKHIQILNDDVAYRKAHDIDSHALPANRDRLQKYQSSLVAIVKAKGLDADQLLKAYKSKSLRALAQELDIEQAYLTNYAFRSSFVHAQHHSEDEIVFTQDGERCFNLGPSSENADADAVDAVHCMAMVLVFAASVLEDSNLVEDTSQLVGNIRAQSSTDCGTRDR